MEVENFIYFSCLHRVDRSPTFQMPKNYFILTAQLTRIYFGCRTEIKGQLVHALSFKRDTLYPFSIAHALSSVTFT